MSSGNRISVAMTVFNGERFVLQELESLARQARLPDELVICDDRSEDRSLEIIRDFAANAPFPVRVFVNEKRLGCSKNYERAMTLCTGDLIFIADWDDVWYPERLLLMEEAFERSPGAGVAVCNADLVDENLRPLGRTLWQSSGVRISRRARLGMAQGRVFKSRLAVNGCCLAVRAHFRPLIFPIFDGKPIVFPDIFMVWTILLSGAGGIAVVPKPILAYRQHSAQMCGAGGSAYGRMGLLRQRFARIRTRPPLSPFIERLESQVAFEYSKNRRLRETALRHLRARWNLPASRVARTPVVIRELLLRRYHRFSHGFAAAAKDLLFVE